MKFLKIVIAVMLCCTGISSFSQNINWASLKEEQKHILHINTGWDYGLVYGAGYSYHLPSKLPVLLNASYSFPSGGKVFDDFKIKAGGQLAFYQVKNFKFSGSVHALYRRYENPLVRLQNVGAEISTVIGYYKPKWFASGEIGFDKAIVTHFKHSESFRDNVYAGVQDGWYKPTTGGNFNYGIQIGYSLPKIDLMFKIGKVVTQDFKTTPLIPYYTQLYVVYKINAKGQ